MEIDRHDHVRERAHLIWEREGRPEGREAEHWAQAEREIDNEAAARREPERLHVTTADDPTKAAAKGAAQKSPARRREKS
jgi:hypothetical protein